MTTQLLGAYGEHIAARYLRENGFNIQATNFRVNNGELDIIAEKNNILYFTEVKTRKQGGVYPPAAAVDYRKQDNLRTAAAVYMNRFKLKNEYQFDIIEVLVDENDNVTSVNYIEKAF